jgi:hypothetical protein
MNQDLPAGGLAADNAVSDGSLQARIGGREAVHAAARGALRDVGVIALRVALALAVLCGIVVLLASYN